MAHDRNPGPEPTAFRLDAAVVSDALLVLEKTGANLRVSKILRTLDAFNRLGFPQGDVTFHHATEDPAEMRGGLNFGARLALGGVYGKPAADAAVSVLNAIGTE